MDLYIERDTLVRGLTRAQGVVERRSTNRVLSSVLLEAREGLRLTATDGEVALTGEYAATVAKAGALAVEAQKFLEIVKALPDSTVRLQVSAQSRLEITSGSAWFKVMGTPAVEYPPPPEFVGTRAARLTGEHLRWLVERVQFCVSTDDVRRGINGAHLEAGEGQGLLRMVGTDGHRLAYAQVPFQGELGMPEQRLLPRKAMAELRKLCEDDAAELELSFGENAILASLPDVRFFFRLIDGRFPPYREVLPARAQRTVTVGRELLLAAVKRAALLATDLTRPVRFSFLEDRVVLSTQNLDIGETREEVPAELEGTPVDVGFNARYLAEMLGVARSENVVLQLGDALMPAILKEPQRDDALFVIMPMRLD